MPQHAAQGAGKVDLVCTIDLHLHKAGDLIFDGVFDGDDVLHLSGDEFTQRGIERGRFAGTRGAS